MYIIHSIQILRHTSIERMIEIVILFSHRLFDYKNVKCKFWNLILHTSPLKFKSLQKKYCSCFCPYFHRQSCMLNKCNILYSSFQISLLFINFYSVLEFAHKELLKFFRHQMMQFQILYKCVAQNIQM